jgi:hypothetical protein
MQNRLLFLVFFLSISAAAWAQDSTVVKVHFLYGSKPKRECKKTERKWFGGILGGHTGIETNRDMVLHFLPKGKFHRVENHKDRHSCYQIDALKDFWQVFGGKANKVKTLTIAVPVSMAQKKTLDSLAVQYMKETPYDYAFWGMRCGAATYEKLAQIGIFKQYSRRRTYRKIFYPKKLRRKLIRKAEKNGWKIERQAGDNCRRWERD